MSRDWLSEESSKKHIDQVLATAEPLLKENRKRQVQKKFVQWFVPSLATAALVALVFVKLQPPQDIELGQFAESYGQEILADEFALLSELDIDLDSIDDLIEEGV